MAWPSAVSSDSNNGTIEYVTANPTTFITSRDGGNSDWYYTGSYTTDNTRWTESSSPKSIYDPCPAGWRVPDGSENGVWSRATGTSGILLRAISINIVDMFLMSKTVPFIGLPRLDVRMHGGRRVCTSTIRPL